MDTGRRSYRILYEGGTAEIVEKKSRFIADIRPVKTEEEALAFVEEVRKRYWDAKHHCYAWIIGERGEGKRCGDDGEPSQTAGRPMLDVLEGDQLTGVCAVVTRYFGGTLLGTGGLVRAYSGAVRAGLDACTILNMCPAKKTAVSADYGGVGKLQYLFGTKGIAILDSRYGENVVFTVLVPDEDADGFVEEVTELTGGKAKIEIMAPVFYGVNGREIVIIS